jgi:hypothetical protein
MKACDSLAVWGNAAILAGLSGWPLSFEAAIVLDPDTGCQVDRPAGVGIA